MLQCYNCFCGTLPTISENPRWQILPVLTVLVIPPPRVLTPLPPCHAVVFAVLLLDPCPSQSASWHKCISASFLSTLVPTLDAHPTLQYQYCVGPQQGLRKKEGSVISVLFFKTPTFHSLLFHIPCDFFFKKSTALWYSVAWFLSFWHPLKFCTRGKCLARLTLGPALSCGPLCSHAASVMKAFSAGTRLDLILGCLPQVHCGRLLLWGELLSSAGLGHLVPLWDQGSCIVLFPALHSVHASPREHKSWTVMGASGQTPGCCNTNASLENVRGTDRQQVLLLLRCYFALTVINESGGFHSSRIPEVHT